MNVFFLDVQTTGPNPSKGAVLEIAWGDSETESIVVKTPEEPPPRILAMIGLTPKELETAREPAEAAEKLRKFAAARQGAVCVIHYARFERPFLEALLGEIPFEIICTHELAKRVVPQLPSRGLRGLAGFFGFDKGEQKRAASHIEATRAVWRGLGEKMESATVEAAKRWLNEPVPKREAYAYPIDRFKRLDLSDRPGVYRFLNKQGAVLYVGKATSLKSRVNSYFRGKKGRDSRKLEMLTQALDLKVTECANILEASMLESDLIKELNPPYNLALKSAHKSLIFYSPDFRSVRVNPDREHPNGPFTATGAMERLWLFCEGARAGAIPPEVFYEPVVGSVLSAGLELFLKDRGLTEGFGALPRRMLAYGYKVKRALERVQEDLEPPAGPELADNETEAAEEEAEREWTPEDVAAAIEGLATSAAYDHQRSKAIRRLVDAEISWTEKRRKSRLTIRGGRPGDSNGKAGPFMWTSGDVKTYDRLSVLASEIAKARSRGVKFLISRNTLG